MKKIALLTGGGDCPGLNAVIRAVVRRALLDGWEIIGFRNGWAGVIKADSFPLTRERVSGILHLGGTILGTSRTNPTNVKKGDVPLHLQSTYNADKNDLTDEVLKTWLDRLVVRNGWLDIGRKRPIPHESWFQVAGYFFYYGHYYAARCVELLPPEERRPYQDHLAMLLTALQSTLVRTLTTVPRLVSAPTDAWSVPRAPWMFVTLPASAGRLVSMTT